MWGRHLDEGRSDAFEDLQEIIDITDYDATSVLPVVKQHIASVMGLFKKSFPENGSQYDSVRDSFNLPAPAGFRTA